MVRHQDVSAQQEAQPAARFFENGDDRSELRIAQSRKRAPQIYRDEEDTIRSAQAMDSRHGQEDTRITSPLTQIIRQSGGCCCLLACPAQLV